MGATPADIETIKREWEAALEAVNVEYRKRMVAALMGEESPASAEPIEEEAGPTEDTPGVRLPAKHTRNRRVLDAMAARQATQEWISVREIAEAIGPAEEVTATEGELWATFSQQVRNSLSALKKLKYVVDRGYGTGGWKLSDPVRRALGVGT